MPFPDQEVHRNDNNYGKERITMSEISLDEKMRYMSSKCLRREVLGKGFCSSSLPLAPKQNEAGRHSCNQER